MNALVDFIANTVTAGVGVLAGSQATLRAYQNLQPHPFPHQFAAVLDSSLRLQYLQPAEMLGLYGLSAGMTVLEIGCGTGLVTVEMARMVGEQGRVHAVDLQQPLLARTRDRVHGAGVAHLVQLHHCGAGELPFPDDSIDLAVLASTLGEIPDKPAVLSELRRVLRPDGRLGVSDEMIFPAYMLSGSSRRWIEEAGFRFLAKTGSLFYYRSVYNNAK